MMRNKEKAEARKKPLFESLERPFTALDLHLSQNAYLLGDERWSIADLNVVSIVSPATVCPSHLTTTRLSDADRC